MADTTQRSTEPHAPSGMEVLGRVWAGGMRWGLLVAAILYGGMLGWVVAAEVRGDGLDGGDILEGTGPAVLVLLVFLVFGFSVGLGVALVSAPILVATRRWGVAGVRLTWLLALLLVAVLCELVVRTYLLRSVPVFTAATCLVSAWPVWRTLHRAVRGTPEPAAGRDERADA